VNAEKLGARVVESALPYSEVNSNFLWDCTGTGKSIRRYSEYQVLGENQAAPPPTVVVNGRELLPGVPVHIIL